jgi:hypothetical protein
MLPAMAGAAARNNRPAERRGEGEGAASSYPRAIALFVALVFPLFALSGCGLEDNVAYLNSPYFKDNSGTLTLTHNSSNNAYPFFLGYDIYYRAYSNLSDADTARTTIEAATNLTSSTPESVLSQLTSTLSFKKIYLASAPTVMPTPLFNFTSIGNANGASTITIQLDRSFIANNWYFSTDVNSTHIEIVRGINTSSNNSFNYSYISGDIDFASSSSVVPGATVYIVAFAVAYGFDFTTLATYYSFPTSLFQEVWGGYTLPST